MADAPQHPGSPAKAARRWRPGWRLGALLALALALALWWRLAPSETLTLAALQARHTELVAWYELAPWRVRSAFFALYLLAATLSLPGVAVLTLAAGAVFGLAWGLLLVSFASSLGATISFWLARYLLGDLVRARMGPRLLAVRSRLEREGALYLLSLRLIPLVPFGAVNLLMGLTDMRSRTFYAVSQLGMLASTVVFVAAGQQLASISSASDVLSPALLGMLVGLGALVALLPSLSRGMLERLRKLRAPWRS